MLYTHMPAEKYYRGYVLIRLSKIGTEWEISEKMMKMKDPKGPGLLLMLIRFTAVGILLSKCRLKN